MKWVSSSRAKIDAGRPGRPFVHGCPARLRAARAAAALATLGALWWGGVVGPSAAAVRVCGDRVTSGSHEAETETLARAAAIAAWTKRAQEGATGGAQPAWRIAVSRTLSCRRVDGGQVACEAVARPCVIQQKPPEGGEKLPRQPRPKGPAIEI